jgi:tyrocidine synthetase-3
MGKLDRRNVEEVLSLTPLQEGMLFHYLKDRGKDLYFEQLCLHISGRLDRSIFERAWKAVVEDNESLRTIFRWQGVKEPVQIILKESDFKPGYCDLSGQPGAVETLKARDRQERFDLSCVPFRVTLGRTADDRHLMLVSSHHILYDGWSNWLILKEFFEAYGNGGDRPGEPSKPSVRNGFREFVGWLQNRDIKKEAGFWQDYLEGLESFTGLLLSGKRRRDIGETGTHKVVFSSGEKAQLTRFVKEHKITPASFMYCVWGIILQKYNYRHDVVFGTVVSGRSAKIKGIEEMVGLFINTLPLRVQTNAPEKIVDFLERVSREVRIREEYEGTPLVNIKEYSQRGQQAELFDTIVGIENYPLDLGKLRENNCLSVDAYSMQEATHYPLTLNVSLLFDEMEAGFTFDPERFEPGVIERLARHFKNAIRHIIDSPQRRTAELEILSPEERGQIITDFNDTEADYPADKTIHRLVEDQVERTPHRIAVVSDDTHLSYDALNRRANRLAHRLTLRGVKTGMVVGILLESPGQRVTAMLAILKAGSAYLPLDPGQPLKRIAAMLDDCQAPLLLTGSQPPLTGLRPQVIPLDEMGDRLAKSRDENPAPEGGPLQPAYVMFTSGSTGQPKGVMIEHRSVVNTVHWFGRTFGIDGSTHLLQLSDYTFDPSVEDIFGSLVHGAALHLIDRRRLLDSPRLRRFIRQRQIHIIDYVPPLLDELLDGGERLESLRVVISGGMPLDERLKDLIMARGYRLYNNYGPTEITVDALCGRCTDGPVTLGKPIANVHGYILDKDRQLAPIGAAGELCIAGTGLARGYLNNPELTAEKFVNLAAKVREDTQSLKRLPNTNTLYRTGDLARWLPGGTVEFLGRIDRQVKIRGVRIELSEIENRLLEYPGLREAAVTVRGDGEADKHLCAYVVPDNRGDRADAASMPLALKEYLARELPAYMIPAQFVLLEEMPRTAAGKLDRRALPAPAGERPADGRSGNVMAAGVEGRLADIWARVLKIDRDQIGRDQSFFDLGGHSLRATRLMSEIYKAFNVKVDIDRIFQTPSLRGLSQTIEKSKTDIYESIRPVEEREYYPLSSAQKRMYLLNQLKESDISDNSPGAMMLEGRVSRAHLQSVFEKLIRRHEILRTAFVLRGSEPVQVVYPQVPFSLGYADSRQDQLDREIERFVRPFDLAAAPLLRVQLLKLAGPHYLLIYDMHHIVVDDTSAGLFLEDFIALYNGRELPCPRLQYRDFADWQNKQQDSRQLREQEHYWLNVFAAPPPPFELPVDFPRPTLPSFEGRFIRGCFPPDLTAAVNRLAKENSATLYMVLLALTSILLGRCCGREDIVIGTPIAGRLHPDLYDIMGFFVNTLAMRSFPEGHKTFGKFLLEVKAAVLAAFENQDYPFDRLVGQVAAVQEAGRQRLFDIMLVVQNVDIPLEELLSRIKGVTFKPYEFQKQATQFDILLHAFESDSEIGFRLDYATRLFKEETVVQLLKHLANIAREVTADPQRKISALKIFSDQEQAALTVPSSWERLSQAAEEVDFDF